MDNSGAVNPNLPVLAKVSFLVEVLHLNVRYELVELFWCQLTLTIETSEVDVNWSRNEVLVGFIFDPQDFWVSSFESHSYLH